MKTCSHSSGFFREWLDVHEMKNAGFAYCFQKFKYKKNVPKDFLYTERKRKNGNSRKDNENRSCNKKNQSHIRKRECKTPDNNSNVICNCSYSDVYGDSCTVYAGLYQVRYFRSAGFVWNICIWSVLWCDNLSGKECITFFRNKYRICR